MEGCDAVERVGDNGVGSGVWRSDGVGICSYHCVLL